MNPEVEAVVLLMWHDPIDDIVNELVRQFSYSHEYAREITASIIEREYEVCDDCSRSDTDRLYEY